jgi:ketosteroid isomerase-like protein
MSASARATSSVRSISGATISSGRARTPRSFPVLGRHEGKQAAIEVLQRTVGAWDMFELNADEFIEQADTVVMLGHVDVAKDERSARLPVVHIWRYRGDEEICRLQILTDTLESARILGIV